MSDHEAAVEQQQYWDTREQVLREVQLQHPIKKLLRHVSCQQAETAQC